jgi:folate-binding protein YgfZ
MPSPLAEISGSLGARFGDDRSGIAIDFCDWQEEYFAAELSAALWDRSDSTKVEVTGKDRSRFLHNLCTNDIKNLAVGRGCEAFFTNSQGKTLFFTRLFSGSDSIWIDTVPGAAPALLAHLDRYRISEKVDFVDRSDAFAQVLAAGPSAIDCVADAAGSALPSLEGMGHAVLRIAGTDCAVVGNDALVQPAVEIRIPVSGVVAVWAALWDAAQPRGARPAGSQAFETLRIEAGWPESGRDFDESNLPQEIGRTARAVSFTKGCYLGQETVARIDALGHVNRHLVRLAIPSITDTPTAGGTPLASDGKTCGNITSAAYSPSRKHTIALGYVRRGYEREGTKLTMVHSDQNVEVIVQ